MPERLRRRLRYVWRRLRYIARSGARRRFRDLVVMAGQGDAFVVREDLARRYLSGDGVEIGPLTWPLRLPPRARVRYVDRLYREDLVRVNPGSGAHMHLIPETDVIDDAERLETFDDESVDFVVANHVLEHIEDPISALQHFLRVIRPGGILFLTLPDARHTFDSGRERTTVDHLLRDHEEGPLASRRQHYEEWARYIERVDEEGVGERVAEYARESARHHFHVWELDDFLALLRALELPCDLELAQTNQREFAVILRKNA